MIFEQDFIEFIEFLNLHHVDYMIVGAHALAYHGRPSIRETLIFGLNRVLKMLPK
ncbi:hypothetical protein ACVWYN_001711 [Pedobacter sp. UYP24]